MATTVFACGYECGFASAANNLAGAHLHFVGSASFSTSIVRTGLRSVRLNPSASTQSHAACLSSALPLSGIRELVWTTYIRFETLPNQNTYIHRVNIGSNAMGFGFQTSDSTLRLMNASGSTYNFSTDGYVVTTGVWYLLEVKVTSTANPWTADGRVNGNALTQITQATAAQDMSANNDGFGPILAPQASASMTADVYFDDLVVSQTAADYPLGSKRVFAFTVISDGTHNVAGANDFERSSTGTDILNSTTDAFQLINDIPCKTANPPVEFINLIAPPNVTDYVECIFGVQAGTGTPAFPDFKGIVPNAIDVVVIYAALSASAANNIRLAINDNGTLSDVHNGSAQTTAPTLDRKHYVTAPTGAAWNLAASGNGSLPNLRMRTFTNDAAPDPWLVSVMLEAVFPEIPPEQPFLQIKQAVKRAASY